MCNNQTQFNNALLDGSKFAHFTWHSEKICTERINTRFRSSASMSSLNFIRYVLHRNKFKTRILITKWHRHTNSGS